MGRNLLVAALGLSIVVLGTPGARAAGPQIRPCVCQKGAADAQCNAPTTYELQYMDGQSRSLQPYDRTNPPAPTAIAPTTTDQGVTVPFVVRTETGYLDRDQYKIAVL